MSSVISTRLVSAPTGKSPTSQIIPPLRSLFLLTIPDTERARILEVFKIALGHDNCIACIVNGSQQTLHTFFDMGLDASLKDGEVWVAGYDNRIDAVALWIKPGTDHVVALQEKYQALFVGEMKEWLTSHFALKYQELYTTAYPTGVQRRIQAWHLNYIAVDPQYYRRGLGKALVCAVRDKADRDNQTMTTDVPTSHSPLYTSSSIDFEHSRTDAIARSVVVPLSEANVETNAVSGSEAGSILNLAPDHDVRQPSASPRHRYIRVTLLVHVNALPRTSELPTLFQVPLRSSCFAIGQGSHFGNREVVQLSTEGHDSEVLFFETNAEVCGGFDNPVSRFTIC
ncbi:hypothetical protein EW146_g5895 [Bondarzewia mesenterica]|uniref:N-acetyltransferase domain-containing protein n=1 Tax=Bondarzewia mesenterica TaxID=1095465 RepID=A0A4S4LQ46_9AGAM|nr:hypothetical protein EW146_g5895 [Bondarzewia mesenterica]